MFRRLTTVLSVMFVASSAFASPNLFHKAGYLYSKAGVPNLAHVKPQALWLGKCIERGYPEEKKNSGIFFYVDVDTVLGNNFYLVPLNPLHSHPFYTKEAHRAVCDVTDHKVQSFVINDKIERAWRTTVIEGNGPTHYFLREGKGADESQVFFAQAVRDNEVVKFCYYYQQLTEDQSDEEIVPAPVPPRDLLP